MHDLERQKGSVGYRKNSCLVTHLSGARSTSTLPMTPLIPPTRIPHPPKNSATRMREHRVTISAKEEQGRRDGLLPNRVRCQEQTRR
ncbi:hypothetical protein BDA96_06G263900 [Sorghum bicolor]|uniref:Uncharacterized protein n=1 Tax=Sorghum bicolor TaxID=4558 RepID=A0A921QU96_SORBI|nr:hypothetical protein BDA96_06G263900 [Sorghum bicolor]